MWLDQPPHGADAVVFVVILPIVRAATFLCGVEEIQPSPLILMGDQSLWNVASGSVSVGGNEIQPPPVEAIVGNCLPLNADFPCYRVPITIPTGTDCAKHPGRSLGGDSSDNYPLAIRVASFNTTVPTRSRKPGTQRGHSTFLKNQNVPFVPLICPSVPDSISVERRLEIVNRDSGISNQGVKGAFLHYITFVDGDRKNIAMSWLFHNMVRAFDADDREAKPAKGRHRPLSSDRWRLRHSRESISQWCCLVSGV